jgi:hypothetical protein
VTDKPCFFQPLLDRLAGLPVDETLYDGVPDCMDPPLRQWIARALRKTDGADRRVAMRHAYDSERFRGAANAVGLDQGLDVWLR